MHASRLTGAEAALDGIYVIRTNVPAGQLDTTGRDVTLNPAG
jgi:hypothetical protein